MLEYVVVADRHAVVDGLGVFSEGEPRTFTQEEVDRFTDTTGLKLNQGNLPEGLELTIAVKEGE